jgi:UDP-glucose 4-epimerase
MSREKIFITGGCGFIGANLVKYLLDRDAYRIMVYDNLSVGSKSNLERSVTDSGHNYDSVELIEGDILDKNKLNQAIKGHKAIVHLAAHTRVIESLQNPEGDFGVNIVGTFNVLEAARNNKIDKFVFASSNAVVGEQTPPINEEMIPKPISPYGASKLYGEALCSAYYRCYGLKAVSFRFANAYGPYSDHKTSVVSKFIKRVERGKTLKIYGDGNQTRDFIHVQDICQPICLSLDFPVSNSSNSVPWGEIFQIATGEETRIIDLAKMINSLFGHREEDIIFSAQRKGEIRRNFSDISKAKRMLNYEPQVKLYNGLRSMLEQAR